MGDYNNFEHMMPPVCHGELAQKFVEQCEQQYKKAMEKAKYDKVWEQIKNKK